MPVSVVTKSVEDVCGAATRAAPARLANACVRFPACERNARPLAPPLPAAPCMPAKPSIRPSPLRSTPAANTAAFGRDSPVNAAKLASRGLAAGPTRPS